MTTSTALRRLRAQARLSTLHAPTGLAEALHRLGFVQADPIRAPARAQDLILRHRVRGYRAGDLERRFTRLGLEEDFLYAYGVMPPETRQWLHPRPDPAGSAHLPAGLAREVLDFVRGHGLTHPRDLEARFGRDRAVNGWGGFSKATTRALESLHHYGLLRVARRQNGIRLYEAALPVAAPGEVRERAHRLVMLVARILAPVPLVSLRGALALMARRNPGLGPLSPVVVAALRSGELERGEIEGETYLWPAAETGWRHRTVPRDVRLLAPFDPLVWDRRRFEHLWGWAYRFEAYTPPSRRRFGYYALPMLWGDAVIGWANISVTGGGMQVTPDYVQDRPRSRDFHRALEAELARMERFLAIRAGAPGEGGA
ncbi:DNA glycosylase AlkZ-like family protein [Roseomonas marmotae]|uniref:YcaQ family DNA glycosylase n=1 Tax=Roseomonas marmotae TaxID=2768161 RepID=A0ABS3KEH2_9PROT|nr:crosslink repair DNA glycosylase YcaQ family protein [Roseomonas marmotae]MBO1075063.1 YcaQ family DNA glycosylase [Roseomonas marmotae]QTI79906.1 YcaQ family DNA glycosylase [Roseomonas marmotae]